ncbi:zf-HC2 domain-containing protein [Nocardioides bigeumensis]|uniref:zf-HC2 domain-containing protein n=1 Tax=Nocardioides bigeumensis TaxID=433657 RepID=UPI0031D4F0B2
MIGHLGPRVSALLDGQLSAEEAEKAWAHVHACHACRDLVEREGWVKTQLAGLSAHRTGETPDRLKGALAHGSFLGAPPLRTAAPGRGRSGVAFLGGTALGAAVAGVLALGVAQGGAPADRRPPVTSLNARPSSSPAVTADLRLATRHATGGIAGVKIVP